VRIDHVVYAVRDLDDAAELLEAEHGLTALPGGVHPRWGTANRIAPLGRDYVELISVIDPSVAAGTVLGRTLLALTEGGDRWFSVCVADDDIDATAGRLGLVVDPGSRTRPDGAVVAWRAAGIDEPSRQLDRPFFIRWEVPPELHPGAAAAVHRSGATGIVAVEISGDADGVRDWLGGADLPIEVTPGPPGVVAVRLTTHGGELRIA